jgi:uracil-DNA glycosylase family 4
VAAGSVVILSEGSVATGELPAPDVLAVAAAASQCHSTDELDTVVASCRACPRLVAWRELVARTKRAAFADQPYWGRPVPSWGPPDASLAILGLAPAAHGGNRTGRIFTGDRSGDWLFAALHRAGLAALPTSVSADDDQRLIATRILAAVHCAPPDNKPTPGERDACRAWLVRDFELLRPTLRAVLVLGAFAWTALWPALRAAGYAVPGRRPAFGHGVNVTCGELSIFGCYHPSQQNTFTGKLTAAMLDDVVGRAAGLALQPWPTSRKG